MTLKDVNLKHCYDSDEDDILNEFYIPVLKNSFKYQRLAGFFRSSTLAVAARGIQGLLENNGEMQLIAGAVLSKQDVDAIKEGIENPEKIIEKSMINDLSSIEDEFVKDHINALSWMIAKKKLEIKIAIVTDDSGKPLDRENIEQRGIFHQKIGIFEDNNGNNVSFSGSVNESASGWKTNIEDFNVFRGWVDTEKSYLEADIKRFNKFWHGDAIRARIIDMPTAIHKELIRMAPSDYKQLNLIRWSEKKKKDEKKITLRPYQNEAISKWYESDNNGIFEMATGTGKTFTALGCLKKILNENKRLVTVIACPYGHLIKQWRKEILNYGLNNDIIIADSSNPKWKNELANYLFDIKNKIKDNLIVLTTHDTFPSNDFIKIIKTSPVKIFLNIDEVHGIGAPIRKTGLIEEYQYRLGLSATPKRWLDTEGTEDIFDYFGDVVYEFSLKKAINTINPETGKTYLTPYEYKPYFVELSEDELIEYEKITTKIARAYYKSKDKHEKSDWFNLLCIKRQKIIVDAVNKIATLNQILDEIGRIEHCLIYTSPYQIDQIQDLLNVRGIIQHKFTMKEGLKPDSKYSGLSEREFLLNRFADGKYQALVAMKCLDEGVDVPPARTAIILASSSNPRQYIQRRGRILRNYQGKDKAVIYDLIVTPPHSKDVDKEIWNLERKIIKKELKRYKEFAYLALNRMECLRKIESLEERYKIVVTVDW
jgi:superfamily II DNA or RNA helicase